jgi:hypothetical protein
MLLDARDIKVSLSSILPVEIWVAFEAQTFPMMKIVVIHS